MCETNYSERCGDCRSRAQVLCARGRYFEHFWDQTGWVGQSRAAHWTFHGEPRRRVLMFSNIAPGGWRLYKNRTWVVTMMNRNFHSEQCDFFNDGYDTHEVVISTEPMVRLVRAATNHEWLINWGEPASDLIGPQPEETLWLSEKVRALKAVHPHRTKNFVYRQRQGGLRERSRS